MIAWLNGAHGVGKTRTASLVQQLITDSRVFDAEMVAEQHTIRERIEGDHVVPSPFRPRHLEAYADAARTWLHRDAEVVDTTDLTPDQVARQVVEHTRSG